MTIGSRIENPQAALPPGPGTLTIIEKQAPDIGPQAITSTSPTLIVGTSQVFALAGAQDVMFTGFASANPSVTLEANVGFGINIDGVDYYGTILGTLNLGGNVQGGLVVTKGLSLAAGNHTVYLFAYRLSAARTPGSIISSASAPSRWEAIFGGGTDAPNEPVVGGSGTQYLTIADAILGETETRVAGVVPQAGTGPGVLVGTAGLSAVNDFYKDWLVVNTDTTPSNGLVAQWARVSSYDGPTRTLTLDKPINFSAESTFLLVDPVRLTLKQDITENVTVNKCAVMDLGGNRVQGKIDVTASEFTWIRGANGYVTNGIQKSDFGVLKVDATAVSRRDATIYAVLMTEGSDLGRCELTSCDLMGRVAGRRGYSGWAVKNCKDLGISTNSNINNTAFALVESISGVSITLSAIDAELDTEMGGAILYSENSISGATAYMSIIGTVKAPPNYIDSVPSPRNFSYCRAVGSGAVAVTVTTGGGNLNLSSFSTITSTTAQQPRASIISVQAATGTVQFSINQVFTIYLSGSQTFSVIMLDSGGDVTGSVTLGGTSVFNLFASSTDVSIVAFFSRLTGSVTVSCHNVVTVGCALTVFEYAATQDSGVPAVSITANLINRFSSNIRFVSFSGAISISVGTYAASGLILNPHTMTFGTTWTSVVSGGAWTFSGQFGAMIATSSESDLAFIVFLGSGGTVTMSGVTSIFEPERPLTGSDTFYLVIHNGTGGTASLSGSVFLGQLNTQNQSILVRAFQSGATASLTGAVDIRNSMFEGGFIICASSAVGAIVNGPTSVTFSSCTFTGAFLTSNGGGTLTWANCSLTFRLCFIEGLATILGGNFSSIQAYHSRFNGNSSNNSVTASGSRPTTYRFWKCSFAAIVNGLTPEIVDDYTVVPANAALTRGNLMSINSSAKAIAALTSSVVEGILLDAASGANTPAILVRRGKVFVSSDAAVVAGDSCVLDAVTTPTNQIKGAAVVGQRTGRALEAVGATLANLAYTEVNLM